MRYYEEVEKQKKFRFSLDGFNIYTGVNNVNKVFIKYKDVMYLLPRKLFDNLQKAFNTEPRLFHNFTKEQDPFYLECTVPRYFGEDCLVAIGYSRIKKGEELGEVIAEVRQENKKIIACTFTIDVMHKILDTIPYDYEHEIKQIDYQYVTNSVWEKTPVHERDYPWHMLDRRTPLNITDAALKLSSLISSNKEALLKKSLTGLSIAEELYDLIPGGGLINIVPIFPFETVQIIENENINSYRNYCVFVHSGKAFLPYISEIPLSYTNSLSTVFVPEGEVIREIHFAGCL